MNSPSPQTPSSRLNPVLPSAEAARSRPTSPALQRGIETLALLGFEVLWGELAAEEFLNQAQPLLQALKVAPREESPESLSLSHALLLRRTLPILFRVAKTLGKNLTPPEQIMLDALHPGDQRLEQFDGFFHRLPAEDQALLLLLDTLALPLDEVALAFHESEASILTRREQAIRALLDWIYADRQLPTAPAFAVERNCFWIQSEIFTPEARPLSERASRHLHSCERCQGTRGRATAVLVALKKSIPPLAATLAQRTLENTLKEEPELLLHGKPQEARFTRIRKKIAPTLARLRPAQRTHQAIPWHQRPGYRSWLGITAVLLVLLTVPRLRALYETHLDRKLESYFAPTPVQLTPDELAEAMLKQRTESGELAQAENNSEAPSPPKEAAAETRPQPPGSPSADDLEGEEAVEAEEEGESTPLPAEPSLRGGVWRFHLKTHSPKELRNQITQYLRTVDVLNRGRGSEGIEAPGGIQFDFTIPKAALPGLRDFLRKTVEKPNPIPAPQRNRARAALESAPFTWYRGKSTTPVPTGQAKVILWLSQI